MPYLHLEVTRDYPEEQKQEIQELFGAIYAKVMQTIPAQVTMAVRDGSDEDVSGETVKDQEPAGMLICDTGSHSTSDQNALLAAELQDAVAELLGIAPGCLAILFAPIGRKDVHAAEWSNLGLDWVAKEID
jgi:phenylpyruvate tautomerase PptA (4-oxalocrotonate tautomerase family)